MFRVKIETGNAAFDNDSDEVARILRELADKICEDGCYQTIKLRDINGNTVGLAYETIIR